MLNYIEDVVAGSKNFVMTASTFISPFGILKILDYGERKKLSKEIYCYATLIQGPTVGQGLQLNQ